MRDKGVGLVGYSRAESVIDVDGESNNVGVTDDFGQSVF